MEIRRIIRENPVLAIMRNVPLQKTEDYVTAVMKGGVGFFEVALNSEHALRQIRLLADRFGGEIYVGAGTATTVDRAKMAMEAGAQFLLSPSADPPVMEYCRNQGIALLPGVMTPSDVTRCQSFGYDVLKLFPAGGMPRGYIRSLKGPLDRTDYLAIGGVNLKNAGEFIREGYLGVGLGGGLMPREAMESEDWEKGSACVAQLMRSVRKARELDED